MREQQQYAKDLPGIHQERVREKMKSHQEELQKLREQLQKQKDEQAAELARAQAEAEATAQLKLEVAAKEQEVMGLCGLKEWKTPDGYC